MAARGLCHAAGCGGCRHSVVVLGGGGGGSGGGVAVGGWRCRLLRCSVGLVEEAREENNHGDVVCELQPGKILWIDSLERRDGDEGMCNARVELDNLP